MLFALLCKKYDSTLVPKTQFELPHKNITVCTYYDSTGIWDCRSYISDIIDWINDWKVAIKICGGTE